MKFTCLKVLIVSLASFVLVNIGYADSLGTLFTSSKDRQKLEKIRNRNEVRKINVVKIEKKEEPIEPVIIKEVIIRDPVALKGIVHRSNGKSTAWVNEGNTFEGNLDSEFIEVPSGEIKSDQVTVIMSDDNSAFKLKVGEVYTPDPIEKEFFETGNTEIE